jgi:hypothetical protein
MKFKDLKIGTKLVLSFSLIILVFVGVSLYQLQKIHALKKLQDEGSVRAEDAVYVVQTSDNATKMYQVIADAQLNRKFEENKKDWEIVKEEYNTEM